MGDFDKLVEKGLDEREIVSWPLMAHESTSLWPIEGIDAYQVPYL